MSNSKSDSSQTLVLVTASDGISLIQTGTPLTRLNYFDGKFLRAADLEAEQRYLRELVKAGNRAGGSGVVHGLDLRLTGNDELTVSPGLAIDGTGQAILVPQERSLSVAKLIEASRGLTAVRTAAAIGASAAFGSCAEAAGETTSAAPARTWYLITVAYAEALCGEEDVYGTLCEQACVTTTDRPLRIEGALLRARPLALKTALATSTVVTLTQIHLRSRLASAYFADKAAGLGSPISAAALHSGVWCAGAAGPEESEVPLGILVREGGSSLFLDLWTARREHIDGPAKRYWQWRMGMRPWSVYLAQILQFQCQLRDALASEPIGTGASSDPCNRAVALVGEAKDYLEALLSRHLEIAGELTPVTGVPTNEAIATAPKRMIELPDIQAFRDRLKIETAAFAALPKELELVHRGIVELPSAGYLPVVSSDTITVNAQVRRLLGDGVDLRFCTCRPDYVAHALEEAQHLERISLIDGLDPAKPKPEVDILVPDGEILHRPARAQGPFFEVEAIESPPAPETASDGGTTLCGVARGEVLPGGGGALYFAGVQDVGTLAGLPIDSLEGSRNTGAGSGDLLGRLRVYFTPRAWDAGMMEVPPQGAAVGLHVWLEARCDLNPFESSPNGVAVVKITLVYGGTRNGKLIVRALDVDGKLLIDRHDHQTGRHKILCTFTGDLQLLGLQNGAFVPLYFETLQAKPALALGYAATGGREVTIQANIAAAAGGDQALMILNSALAGKLAWAGEPISAEGSYAGINITPDRTFSAKEDEALADPADERSRQAVDAILALGREMAGSEFADMALAQLFPPAPPPSGSLLVRATRDWVLFHRRRETTCAADVPAAVLQPTRTFVVYRLSVASEEALEEVNKALEANKRLSRFNPQRVGSLRFLPGLPTLTGSGEGILEGWPEGERLALAAVANASAVTRDEGEAIANGRLKRVIELVAAKCPPIDPGFEVEVLDRVPTGLDSEDGDGVMLMLSLSVSVRTDCHGVYLLTSGSYEGLDALLKNGALSEVLMQNQPFTQYLGRVNYSDQSAAIVGDRDATAVAEAWKSGPAGGCPPVQVWTFRRDGAATQEDALIKARSEAILRLLGADTDVDIQMEVAPNLPDGCPAISLVRPRSACMQVYRLKLTEEAIKALTDGAVYDLAKGGYSEGLGSLSFCARSGDVLVNQLNVLTEYPVKTIRFALQPGNETVNANLAKDLVEKLIVSELSANAVMGGIVEMTPAADSDWPGNCPILVFMVRADVD